METIGDNLKQYNEVKDYKWSVYFQEEQWEDRQIVQLEGVDIVSDGTLEEGATMVDQVVYRTQLW